MREDLHTPNVEAAATWQRHHAPDHDAPEHIAADDVAPMAGDPDDDLGTARWGDGVREALAAELRRLG